MGTIPVNDVALASENEFAFLESVGFPLTEWHEIFPDSFKGGFKLIFRSASGMKVTIHYSDYEFWVRAGSKEVFGATKHDSFAGNMFSREHLIPALPKIRAAVEPALLSFAACAT